MSQHSLRLRQSQNQHHQPRRSRCTTITSSFLLLSTTCLCSLLTLLPVSVAGGQLRQTDSQHTVTLGYMQYFNPNYSTITSGYQLDAMELLLAAQLALDDINSGRYETVSGGQELLPGLTLKFDIYDSQYNGDIAAHQTRLLLEPAYNPSPVPIIMGFVGYDEIVSAAMESQVYQPPIISPFVSTPSISSLYPNINRMCMTDQIEVFGLIALCREYAWKKVAVIFNNDGSTASQLPALLRAHAGSFDETNADGTTSPALSFTLYPYTVVQGEVPDITSILQAIRDSGIRIILLSAFASDIYSIIQQAKAMNMIGYPYQYLGSNQWCFDARTITSMGNDLNGLMCTQNYVNETTVGYLNFVKEWEAAYAANPARMFYIPKPSLSVTSYDMVIAVVRALDWLKEAQRACNITSAPLSHPFSNLLPPNMSSYIPSDYSSSITSSGNTFAYTRSTIPITYPEVCPFLLYQVGQGRILNRVIRTQIFDGVSGLVVMTESGDRMNDIGVYNFYQGTKSLVGVMSTQKLFDTFGVSDNVEQNLANYSLSDMKTIVASSAWRASYDPSNFSLSGYWSSSFTTLIPHDIPGFTASSLFRSGTYTPEKIHWMNGATADQYIPIDSPTTTIVIQGVSTAVRVTIIIGVCVIGLYITFLLYFQLRYRETKLIKASSPLMNIIFLIGGYGTIVYILLLGMDSATLKHGVDSFIQLCNVKFFLLSISFSLSFGSLFAKTYRIDSIVNSKKLHVKVVRDRDILLKVVWLLFLDCIIMSTWQGVHPFYRSLTQDAPRPNEENLNELIVKARERCNSSHFDIWIITLLIYKGIVLLFGLYLALRVRKIQIPNLNDSKWIVRSIYTVVTTTMILIILALVLLDSPDIFYLIIGIGMLYICLQVLSLLYLPRVVQLYWGVDVTSENVVQQICEVEKKEHDEHAKEYHNHGNTEVMLANANHNTGTHTQHQNQQHQLYVHQDTSSENNAVKMENDRLKKKLYDVQHELAEMKKNQHALHQTTPPQQHGAHHHSAHSHSTHTAGTIAVNRTASLTKQSRANHPLLPIPGAHAPPSAGAISPVPSPSLGPRRASPHHEHSPSAASVAASVPLSHDETLLLPNTVAAASSESASVSMQEGVPNAEPITPLPNAADL